MSSTVSAETGLPALKRVAVREMSVIDSSSEARIAMAPSSAKYCSDVRTASGTDSSPTLPRWKAVSAARASSSADSAAMGGRMPPSSDMSALRRTFCRRFVRDADNGTPVGCG
ncbi:hypothetical protein ACE1OC_14885 [Streptomyces sp. DSM 116496]|uniref:hypothetical protein n=1 Tax=Streptomyces stoeckheimensis TaxID=3344656 RepID=UPI0038B3A0F5